MGIIEAAKEVIENAPLVPAWKPNSVKTLVTQSTMVHT